MPEFQIIVAVDINNGIGRNNSIPWHLPQDLKNFKNITTKIADPTKINAVIMGRKTWESLPEQSKPLPNRLNVVLSRNSDYVVAENILLTENLNEALKKIEANEKIENIFVIGGAEIYKEAINNSNCAKIWLTKVYKDFNCETFFPEIDRNTYKPVYSSNYYVYQDSAYNFSAFERA